MTHNPSISASGTGATLAQGGERKSPVAGFLLILLFSLALDVFFYSGLYASDDAHYLEAAHLILNTGAYPAEPGLAALRLTLVGWNTLIGWLFGFHAPLIALSYVFFHQLLNVLTYALGKRLFDEWVGLLAMYLVAVTPLAVTFSTTILPDIPMSCFLVLSLLLFLGAYDLRGAGKRRRALLAILAAGMSVGLAYGAKESALIALPFYLVLWLCLERRQERRRAVVTGFCFALGFFAVFGAEWGVLSYLTGHSYLRMAWTVVEEESFTDILRAHKYGLYPLERLQAVYDNVYPWFENTRFDFMLVGAALVYPFVRGRKLALWALVVWYFVYHTWGSERLSEYLPPSLQARYFTPLLPLLFVAYAFIMVKLWRGVPNVIRHPGRRGLVQGLFLFALIVHPLPGLHRCDRSAGKVYWAHAVNSSVRAVQDGLLAGRRPVVLSGTVTRNLAPLLWDYSGERILPADRCHPKSEALQLLRDEGFYYVEHYPARRLRYFRQIDGLDTALHPLIMPFADDLDPLNEVQDLDLGRVEIGGRWGVLRRLKRFDCWTKRSLQLAYTITPFAGIHPDFGVSSAYLYEWVPEKAGDAGLVRDP